MLFFALFLLSSSTWAIVIIILGLGFCLAGIFPTTVSNAGEIVKDSDLAMGTLLALGGLGGIIMPYITGVVAESKGIVGGMITVILGILFMFLFSLINRFRKKTKGGIYNEIFKALWPHSIKTLCHRWRYEKKLCEEAMKYDFKTVAINNAYIEKCVKFLEGSNVEVDAAISFPLGQCTLELKSLKLKMP